MLDLAFLTLLLTQPVIWLLVLAAALLQSPVTLLAALLSRRRARSYSGRHVLITGGSEGIGLEIAKQCAARGAIRDGENALVMHTDYYQPIPLVLRGYGAGAEVTAAGVFADVLRTAWRPLDQ